MGNECSCAICPENRKKVLILFIKLKKKTIIN